MLNSYANSGGNKLSQSQNQSLNINAVSGSILKNHPKSWFMMIDLNSRYANAVLAEGGHKAQKKSTYHSEIPSIPDWDRYTDDPSNDIIILQMMVCGEMKVLAECIYRKDYEVDEGHS